MLNNAKLTKIRNKIISFTISGDVQGYQEYVDFLVKSGSIQYLQTILISDYNINYHDFVNIYKLKKNTFDKIKLVSCVSSEQVEIKSILEQNNLTQIGKDIIIKNGTQSGKHIGKIEISDINPNGIYYTSQFIYNFTQDRDIYTKMQLYSVTYSYIGTYSNGNYIKDDLKMDITNDIITSYNKGTIISIFTYSNPISYIDKYILILNRLLSI
jgi:hypothetical protein